MATYVRKFFFSGFAAIVNMFDLANFFEFWLYSGLVIVS